MLESLFNKVASLCIQRCQKVTPTQVFSSENCEIFKNTFFYRTPLVAASVYLFFTPFFRRHWHRSGVFIINFENISHLGFYC